MTRYVIKHARDPDSYLGSEGGWGGLSDANDWPSSDLPVSIEDDEGWPADRDGSAYLLPAGYVIAIVVELG